MGSMADAAAGDMATGDAAASRPHIPLAPIIAGAIWLALGLLATALSTLVPGDHVLCLFRRITGIPCPACGGTRATGLLAHADIAGALAMNPLVTLVLLSLVAAAAWLLVKPTRARCAALLAAIPGRPWAIATLVAAVAANWWYVLATQG